MQALLLVLGLIAVGVTTPMCLGENFPEHPELSFAGELHIDELAFLVFYEEKDEPVFCRKIEVSSSKRGDVSSHRSDWKVVAEEALPCPHPLRWGEDLGEGWEVVTEPRALERNRFYSLTVTAADGEWGVLDFCIFQNGRIAAHSYSNALYDDPKPIEQCLEEGRTGEAEA